MLSGGSECVIQILHTLCWIPHGHTYDSISDFLVSLIFLFLPDPQPDGHTVDYCPVTYTFLLQVTSLPTQRGLSGALLRDLPFRKIFFLSTVIQGTCECDCYSVAVHCQLAPTYQPDSSINQAQSFPPLPTDHMGPASPSWPIYPQVKARRVELVQLYNSEGWHGGLGYLFVLLVPPVLFGLNSGYSISTL